MDDDLRAGAGALGRKASTSAEVQPDAPMYGFSFAKVSIYPPARSTMKLGRPDAPAEREADRIAEAVASGAGPSREPLGMVSTVAASTAMLQRASNSTVGGLAEDIPRPLQSRIDHARASGGILLRPDDEQWLSSRLGFSFANVALHCDEEAARLADGLGASAFTVGPDVFFGRGQYRPQTAGGQRLLAHELVHTVQQRQASSTVQLVQRAPAAAPSTTDADREVVTAWVEEIASAILGDEADSRSIAQRIVRGTSFEQGGQSRSFSEIAAMIRRGEEIAVDDRLVQAIIDASGRSLTVAQAHARLEGARLAARAFRPGQSIFGAPHLSDDARQALYDLKADRREPTTKPSDGAPDPIFAEFRHKYPTLAKAREGIPEWLQLKGDVRLQLAFLLSFEHAGGAVQRRAREVLEPDAVAKLVAILGGAALLARSGYGRLLLAANVVFTGLTAVRVLGAFNDLQDAARFSTTLHQLEEAGKRFGDTIGEEGFDYIFGLLLLKLGSVAGKVLRQAPDGGGPPVDSVRAVTPEGIEVRIPVQRPTATAGSDAAVQKPALSVGERPPRASGTGSTSHGTSGAEPARPHQATVPPLQRPAPTTEAKVPLQRPSEGAGSDVPVQRPASAATKPAKLHGGDLDEAARARRTQPHGATRAEPHSGSSAAKVGVTYGKNELVKLRKHSQHIRETAREFGVEIPKGPGKPETQAAMRSWVDRVVGEGTTKTGPYMTFDDAIWSRLGDGIVVRRSNGEFLTYLDYRKGGVAHGWDNL